MLLGDPRPIGLLIADTVKFLSVNIIWIVSSCCHILNYTGFLFYRYRYIVHDIVLVFRDARYYKWICCWLIVLLVGIILKYIAVKLPFTANYIYYKLFKVEHLYLTLNDYDTSLYILYWMKHCITPLVCYNMRHSVKLNNCKCWWH